MVGREREATPHHKGKNTMKKSLRFEQMRSALGRPLGGGGWQDDTRGVTGDCPPVCGVSAVPRRTIGQKFVSMLEAVLFNTVAAAFERAASCS